MSSVRLDDSAVSKILSDTAEVARARPDHYLDTREFPLVGSRGTAVPLSVTTQVANGELSIALRNGGPRALGRIRMPLGIFPGTAGSFLRSTSEISDPDADPPPTKIYSTPYPSGMCRSARDGAMA